MKRFIGIAIVALLALGVLSTDTAAQLNRVTANRALYTCPSPTCTAPVSTTDLLEDTLLSYSMPANTLPINGRGVRITVAGTLAANGNAKTVKLYFGATVLQIYTAGTGNNLAWNFSGVVLRAGAAAQVENFNGIVGSGWLSGISGSASETLSGPVLIKVTGLGPTTIGDVTATLLVVESL